jgi:hypothetical protein
MHEKGICSSGKVYRHICQQKTVQKALGMSILKEEDTLQDYSDLPKSDKKVLDDRHGFFSQVAGVGPPRRPGLSGGDATLISSGTLKPDKLLTAFIALEQQAHQSLE